MKYFKNLVCAATLAITSLGFASSANAALITQDILLDGAVYGSVTVNTNAADSFGLIESFVNLVLDGKEIAETFIFTAIVDANNVFAGIESLDFDLGSADGFAYQGIFDAFNPTSNRLDVFDGNGDLISFGPMTLSQPPSVVSEPSIAAMMMLALLALGVRRSRK